MYKVVNIEDLYPVMEEKLRAGGCITLTVTGTSMLPMLRHMRDNFILEPADNALHITDVVLYRRENGQFVLHRIVGLESNGDYVLCGDNQFVREHHITRQQVVGRLQAFIRQGRCITCNSLYYKTYVFLLPSLRLLRRGIFWGRRKMRTLKRLVYRNANGNG